MSDNLNARIRRVLSRLRDKDGLGSRVLLAQEAASLIEDLDALRQSPPPRPCDSETR